VAPSVTLATVYSSAAGVAALLLVVVAAGDDVVAAVVVRWSGDFPKIAPRTNKTAKAAKTIFSQFGIRLFGRGCSWADGCMRVVLVPRRDVPIPSS